MTLTAASIVTILYINYSVNNTEIAVYKQMCTLMMKYYVQNCRNNVTRSDER